MEYQHPATELDGVAGHERPIYSFQNSNKPPLDSLGVGFNNNAYVFTNTDVGRSINWSVQLSRDLGEQLLYHDRL